MSDTMERVKLPAARFISRARPNCPGCNLPQEPQPGRFWKRNDDVTKVAKLTPEQEADLSATRDKWLAIGLSTAPVARALDNARQIGGAVLAFGLALWVLV